MSLQGKNIVVTGGSRGIGAAIVKHLADNGARVAFTYSSKEEAAANVAKSLKGTGHFYVKMDVSDEASVTNALQIIQEKLQDVHGLVNNAGITKDTLLLRMKSEDFDQVIATNLKGTFLTMKGLSKTLMKNQGAVVNITSVIGQTGNPGQANYAASKAGVVAFSKSVALELASRGVRVNCIAPGFIATEMTGALTDEQKAKILEKVPLKSMGEGEDIAHAVRFLLSHESRYITGHTLSVNGGLYME